MKALKRTLLVIVALAAVLALFLTVSLAADTEAEQILSKEKDGLKAELVITNGADVTVKVSNVSGENISNINIDVTLPEGVVLSSGSLSEALTLAVGESKDIAVSLTNTDALPETEPETTPETDPETTPAEQKGCKGAIASAVSVIAVVGIALLLAKKNKKATISCLMLGAMLLGAFAFAMPTSAATTRRSIDLVGVVTYEDKEYSIEVSVSYDHTFTETDVEEAEGMKRFEITYYYGPQGENMYNEYFIETIAEGGFTSIPLENNSVEANKKALELLRKYGLTCSALQDPRLSNLIHANREVTQEEFDQTAAEMLEDYRDYLDVIEGWWLRDEPGADNFEKLSMAVKAFKKVTPDKNTMINLFPTYAKNSQLGTNGYQEYLDEFVSQVNPHYLSTDHYYFRKSGSHTTSFFLNMEMIRDKALSSGLCYMNIFQLTATMQPLAPDLTYDQLEWEANIAMTYGIKRMSYYTFYLGEDWLEAGDDNGCMDYTGKIYPHYYDVQKIHKWLYPLGSELFGKTSVGVFHVMEINTTSTLKAYTSYGDLGEVDGNNFLIGFYDDGSFMVTNKDYAVEVRLDIVDGKPVITETPDSPFIFLDVDSGLQYFNTESATWCDAEADGIVFRNADGKLERNFALAEAFLFRVVD